MRRSMRRVFTGASENTHLLRENRSSIAQANLLSEPITNIECPGEKLDTGWRVSAMEEIGCSQVMSVVGRLLPDARAGTGHSAGAGPNGEN